MARDSLLGGNIFKGLSEARGQDMRREREERERYRSRRSPSFGDMLKQNLMASAASSITAPIGQAIGGAITNVIKTPFQRNAKEFESREDIIKQRRMIKDNKSSGNFLSGIQDTIKKFDGTENEFWKDYAIKRTKGRLTSELTGSVSAEDVPLYDRSMNEQARLYSEESVTYTDPSTGEKKTAPRHTRIRDAFHKARNEYEEASNQGDYDSVLKIANRRPENIIEAALGFGKRMISGQNREEYRTELDRKSFEALENSAIVRENEEFQSAFKLFKDAGDYKGLENYLNAAKADPDQLPSTEVTKREVRIVGGIVKVFKVGSRTTTNPETNTTTTEPTVFEEVASIDVRTPQGQIRALDTGFNYINVASKFLRTEAISEMTRDLKNRVIAGAGGPKPDSIDFLNPKTVEEYNTIRSLINQLLQNKDKVKDNERIQLQLSAVRSIMALDNQSMAELLQGQAMYREQLKNAKSDEEIKEINKKMANLYGNYTQKSVDVYDQIRTQVFQRDS